MATREKGNVKRGALGKGINSLLGDVDLSESNNNIFSEDNLDSASKSASNSTSSGMGVDKRIFSIDPQLIDPNPQQPRRFFHDKDLQELCDSIKVDGVLQPLIVSKEDTESRYTLIAGERRLRASKMAGLKKVPVIIKNGASDDLLRLALIENIQRADLNVIEEAYAYQSLIADYGLTQEQCAQRLGKERSSIANAIRLLLLPKEVQDDVIESRLTMGHGRALLSLEDKKQILRVRDIILKKNLSVRQTEKLCKTVKSDGDTALQGSESNVPNPDLEYIADKLRSRFRTKVKLSGTGSRGKIEISYFSVAELERILGIISKKI
ncbi:MAG: ParB/RepB/Spo0J family partition protein [Bdellovibrionota bacterium]